MLQSRAAPIDGATGICWDNSPAESFWTTFKHEKYYWHVYATKTELVAAIDKWVTFYKQCAKALRDRDAQSRRLRAITDTGCLTV